MRIIFIFMSVHALLFVFYSKFYIGVAKAVELTMYSNPIESSYILSNIHAWEKKTGNKVTVLIGPAVSSDVLALYQQQLAASTSDIDLYQVDAIWAGLLGKHFIDLKPYSNGAEKVHIRSVIESNTVNGRLVAMPLYIDVGMMFYRKDLLDKYAQPIPETWQELAASAEIIVKAERAAGNQKLWGLIFQGRAYEGLTCVALEWLNSFDGGTIVDSEGRVTVNNPNAVAALKEAASWIGTIVPKAALNYSEEEARGVFQSGNSVFMRNWPYILGLGEAANSPIKGKIGVMPIPKGSATGKSSGALGGWGMAVSKYSKNQAAAADLLFHMTSKEGQKQLNMWGSYNPSVIELYSDPEAKAKNPIAIFDLFNNAVPRPVSVTGSKYNRVSSNFYHAVHSVLSGKSSAENALSKLETSLQEMRGDGWN